VDPERKQHADDKRLIDQNEFPVSGDRVHTDILRLDQPRKNWIKEQDREQYQL